MEDYRQSEAYCSYFKNRNWLVEKINNTNVLIKRFPFIGSILIVHRGAINMPLDQLEELAKKHKVFISFIEPNITTEEKNYREYEKLLFANGYKDFSYNLSPTKTIINDLLQTEAKIVSTFNQDIRKNLSNNSTKNIEFNHINSYELFYEILEKAGKRSNLYNLKFSDWKDKWSPFKNDLKMITATLNGELIGANMFIIKPPKAYGIFLPVTLTGRNEHIAGSLLLESFMLAKNNGCTEFDLNGLYDVRYNAPIRWQGLTAFKRKFRGREVEFMPTKIKLYTTKLLPLEKLKMLWIFFVYAS